MRFPFDPLERAREVEEIVCKNDSRKYYRFRFSKYYGGIVTADAVGCCFLCAYCWNYFRNLNPEKYGDFYSSKEVADNILKISRKRSCERIRISGAEPVLGKTSFEHLLKTFRILYENLEVPEFILETNGLVLGYYPELINPLTKFKNFLFVRISIKGWDEKSFELITGARGRYFEYPLTALKNLTENGIRAWPAVMYEIFKRKGMEILIEKLKKLRISPRDIETEYLEPYPFVLKNLRKRGIPLTQ